MILCTGKELFSHTKKKTLFHEEPRTQDGRDGFGSRMVGCAGNTVRVRAQASAGGGCLLLRGSRQKPPKHQARHAGVRRVLKGMHGCPPRVRYLASGEVVGTPSCLPGGDRLLVKRSRSLTKGQGSLCRWNAEHNRFSRVVVHWKVTARGLRYRKLSKLVLVHT